MLLALLAIESLLLKKCLHFDCAIVRVQVWSFTHASPVHPIGLFALIELLSDYSVVAVGTCFLILGGSMVAGQLSGPELVRVIHIVESSILVLRLRQQKTHSLADLSTRDLALA